MAKTDEAKTVESQTDQQKTPARRPWHEPQFMLTDIASTKTQNLGDTDATGFLS